MRADPALRIPSAIARVLTAVGLVALTILMWAPPARATTASELESCFLSEINTARADAGAGALSRDGALSSYGRAHSASMADSGTLFHSSGGDLEPSLPDDWRAWGENVGTGSDSSDCGSLFQGFMDSSGHRANLLDADFDIAGIGVVVDHDGHMWTTHVFVDVASGDTTTTEDEEITTATDALPRTTQPIYIDTPTSTDAVSSTTGAPARDDAGLDDTVQAEPAPVASDPKVADDCTGPLCAETVALLGLLGSAGILGGVLAYWTLRT